MYHLHRLSSRSDFYWLSRLLCIQVHVDITVYLRDICRFATISSSIMSVRITVVPVFVSIEVKRLERKEAMAIRT